MRVVISTGGKFHLFNLAQELEKNAVLSQFITSYPKFEVIKYGIPSNKISSVLIKEIVDRVWKKIPIFKNIYNPYIVHELFDRLASYQIKPADIFVGTSSTSLYTLHKARLLGMKTVLERGSSHILFQNTIIKEEYEKQGVKYGVDSQKVIEKELEEYQMADYISVPSSFAKQTFIDHGVSENKIICVPLGVSINEFKPAPKTDNIFRVIFVGGMSLRKGVHYLLQAFSELNLPNSELLLVGSITHEIKPFFIKYDGKFKWIDHVPQSELYRYYSQSSVFVLNSIEDGFGMVILQAMACGLPIIATTNTGGPDVVRDREDGFIIPIRNVEKLKEKLLYLYENPITCQSMGQSAKERVKEFTWDEYGNKMVKEYEKIFYKTS